jgi:hypothetical protein
VFDDALISRGTHSIKFGFAFELMFLNVLADTDPKGRFADLPSFLTNNPTKFQGDIASPLTPRNLRQNIVGVFAGRQAVRKYHRARERASWARATVAQCTLATIEER